MSRTRMLVLTTLVVLLLLGLFAASAVAQRQRGVGAEKTAVSQYGSQAKSGFWATVALLVEVNNSTFNDDYRTTLFTAKTGKMRIKWHFKPLKSNYTWAVVVFRKGQTPENSLGVSPITMREVSPNSGSKDFKVKKGKQYYLWIEIWHVRADARALENR